MIISSQSIGGVGGGVGGGSLVNQSEPSSGSSIVPILFYRIELLKADTIT